MTFPLQPLQAQLIKATQAWALRRPLDLAHIASLRSQVLLANHAYYLEHIPAYQRWAQQEGIGLQVDLPTLKSKMLLPDEIFKSYSQEWLDCGDFHKMTLWLSEIYHRRLQVDLVGIDSIDGWVERLRQYGLRIVYSSGTSGNFSFVPRDEASLRLFRTASLAYLAPLLLGYRSSAWWQGLLVRLAASLLSPRRMAALSGRIGLQDYDAAFLDFSRGLTGNQQLQRELSPLFRRQYFLYEANFSPSVLRLLSRGARTEAERQQIQEFQALVIEQRQENYQRLIAQMRRATAEGQKVFIFGTSFQYKELCETLAGQGQALALRPGSLVLFGGGWKSFRGEKISRQQLLALMVEQLGLPGERILEGYSMTEINAFMLRCAHGRFHIPPYIEPVIFDEALNPLEGDDLRGVFGFLDPLPIAYPGFIISGDAVHYVYGDCACGLRGAAVTEIGRATAREVKGCGGIMASVAA